MGVWQVQISDVTTGPPTSVALRTPLAQALGALPAAPGGSIGSIMSDSIENNDSSRYSGPGYI